jgi:uncharacterized protein
MEQIFAPLLPGTVSLSDPFYIKKVDANRRYLLGLKTADLLQNHYQEAGLWATQDRPESCHWGWESPTCQIRGHFLGHWLSAAARRCSAVADPELKGKADFIVSEIGRCQKENGGLWAGSIPEKYLDWAARGKPVWAPHYTCHKTFMGLIEMASLTGNEQALSIADRWADWFHAWCAGFSREQMDAILDFETGGMLEAWADLLALTGSAKYRDLLERYYRHRLFDPLVEGRDMLTNMHANTTIPEIMGAARAYEVTGDPRYRAVVEAYWRMAVTERGFYVTGGQTSGEIWTPLREQAARLGVRNQEHCTVYNMMRLAERLLRWTGRPEYADYWERNLWNGIAAQGHWEEFHQNHSSQNRYPERGLISYFLPLEPGSQKLWGSAAEHFWCCHGTLVQANATHTEGIYHLTREGIGVSQLIGSQAALTAPAGPLSGAGRVTLIQETGLQLESTHTPRSMRTRISVSCEKPAEFTLLLRLPWWTSAPARVSVNGAAVEHRNAASSYLAVRRTWSSDTVELMLPRALSAWPLPDRPDSVAFMDGPVALAGLSDTDRVLHGERGKPETILVEDDERDWTVWKRHYRARGRDGSIRFVPLFDIGNERYTVYFPVEKPEG